MGRSRYAYHTPGSLPLTLKREEVLARLKAKMPEYVEFDKKVTAQHKLAEKAAHDKFKAACREAAKWSYKQAAANYFRVPNLPNRPQCPMSRVRNLKRIIAMVEATPQPRMTLSENGRWFEVYEVITADMPAPKDVS